jgi:hypothetical protein
MVFTNIEAKRLMLVVLKSGSFDVALQKHQNKSLKQEHDLMVFKRNSSKRRDEMMDKERKIHTWAMNSWFGMPYFWETKNSIISSYRSSGSIYCYPESPNTKCST